MQSRLKMNLVLALCICLIIPVTFAHAQSGSRYRSRSAPSQRYAPRMQGSDARGPRMFDKAVALEGYCAVCIIDAKKWVRGNPQFAVS